MTNISYIDHSIILTLNYIQGIKSKKYSYPSQKKILLILKDIYGIDICLRTLNYHLSKLERLHFIYRQRRNPLISNGCKSYQTTLYSLARKAYEYLSGLFNCLKDGYYSIKGFLKRKYISSRKELKEDHCFFSPDENIRRLRKLRAKL